MTKTAKYFETFNGCDYFRDKFSNVYMRMPISGEIAFCSNLKREYLIFYARSNPRTLSRFYRPDRGWGI